MERQTGLGRSLEDVLDSMTPVDSDATAPGRVHFEPEDLEQQLDQLMGDIRDLRERVQHLVGMVSEDAVIGDSPTGGPATNGHATEAVATAVDPPKKNKKKSKNKKSKSKKKSKKD
jgi:hypothetical protein